MNISLTTEETNVLSLCRLKLTLQKVLLYSTFRKYTRSCPKSRQEYFPIVRIIEINIHFKWTYHVTFSIQKTEKCHIHSLLMQKETPRSQDNGAVIDFYQLGFVAQIYKFYLLILMCCVLFPYQLRLVRMPWLNEPKPCLTSLHIYLHWLEFPLSFQKRIWKC